MRQLPPHASHRKIMQRMFRIVATALVSACAALIVNAAAHAQAQPNPPAQKGASMSQHATGPFDVKLTPQEDKTIEPLARMSIDKQFHGDLEATSKGEMLSSGSGGKGSSGGYVALERVTGKLAGRSGSFVLQHSATMDRGVPHLSITVVPDSGTDELTGLSGSMSIRIEEGGKHFYSFDYSLPEKP